VLFGGRDQAGSVADLGDHLHVSVGEEPRQTLTQEAGVFGDHDP
jgi:hypothetical protein